MATTARQKTLWSIGNVAVIAWALFPVWWLVSLSFKLPANIATDGGSFWPTAVDAATTTGASSSSTNSSTP